MLGTTPPADADADADNIDQKHQSMQYQLQNIATKAQKTG